MRTQKTFNDELRNCGCNVRILGEFINNKTPTLFICLICEHKWFTAPKVILKNKSCKYCSFKNRRLQRDEINNRLKIENRPERLVGEILATSTKTKFYSIECGHEWLAKPNDVLNGSRCSICYKKDVLPPNEIENRLKDRNIILTGDYTNNSTKTTFLCLICEYGKNGEWTPKPNDIFNGIGCPKCANYGFDPSKPAILYYIKLIEYDLYKIGITNRTVAERFKTEKFKYEIFLIEYYNIGQDAYDKEQKILKEFNDYRYNGDQIIKHGGNTEIFTKNIIEDIINIINTS